MLLLTFFSGIIKKPLTAFSPFFFVCFCSLIFIFDIYLIYSIVFLASRLAFFFLLASIV